MSEQKVTGDEFLESMTGFEEIAVEKQFGTDVLGLAEHKATMFTRALVFVMQKRDGRADKDAYDAVMNMPLSEVQDHFAEPEDEVMPSEPETEPGKDGLHAD
jgi:hypothetical protein